MTGGWVSLSRSVRSRYFYVLLSIIVGLAYFRTSPWVFSESSTSLSSSPTELSSLYQSLKSVSGTRSDDQPIAVFIGILTTADRSEHRAALRKIYGRVLGAGRLRAGDTLVVNYILGRSTDSGHDALQAEVDEFGDLIFLNITENMNDGKTWHYFTHMGRHLRIVEYLPGYHDSKAEFDFVAKVDDDAFLNLPAYFDSLRPHRGLPEVYHGRLCNAAYMNGIIHEFPYHCGFCYTMSADLPQFLSEKASKMQGQVPAMRYWLAEDVEAAGWLIDNNKTANWASLSYSRMYRLGDHARGQADETKIQNWLAELDQRDIVIHGLKDVSQFRPVADWFWENSS
jgi:hypothetical protein